MSSSEYKCPNRQSVAFKLFGRQLTPAFHRHFESVESQLSIPVCYEAQPGLGASGSITFWGSTRVIGQLGVISVNDQLDDDVFSHTVAHEHGHLLNWINNMPKPALIERSAGEGTRSVRAQRQIGVLECVAIDRELRQLGSDPSFSVEYRRNNAIRQFSSSAETEPELGSTRHLIFTMIYVRAGLEQPPTEFKEIRALVHAKWPKAARLGDRLMGFLESRGFETYRQRRRAYKQIIHELKAGDVLKVTGAHELPDWNAVYLS